MRGAVGIMSIIIMIKKIAIKNNNDNIIRVVLIKSLYYQRPDPNDGCGDISIHSARTERFRHCLLAHLKGK